jgi:translation initiation factor 3 subunit M
MPVPTNTLLIEGAFSELAEELAQYIDNLAKVEGNGVQADIQQSLSKLKELEASSESPDQATELNAKNDILKKIVTKAQILNTAPERGRMTCSTCITSPRRD